MVNMMQFIVVLFNKISHPSIQTVCWIAFIASIFVLLSKLCVNSRVISNHLISFKHVSVAISIGNPAAFLIFDVQHYSTLFDLFFGYHPEFIVGAFL